MSDDPIVRDSNGTPLQDGDSVTLIKDLKVKGTSETIKRGTLVKGIRLTADPELIECNTRQVKGLVLRTEFLTVFGRGLSRVKMGSSHCDIT
jgi:protein PhnA